jgi:colanic acid/amylovoran biosynthesis glycosyltransferase
VPESISGEVDDRGSRAARDASVVAVYRWTLLPPSETFIRNEALGLKRYSAVFVGGVREPGLQLPPSRTIVGMPGGHLRRDIRRRLPMYDPARRVERLCRARRVELVHGHFGPDGLSAMNLARELGVPLVVTFWGFDATMTDAALIDAGLGDYVQRRAELFDEADLLISVSGFIADELRARGAPDSKLRVHHVGVPLDSRPRTMQPDPVVLFVGRHVDKKGLGTLIDAMATVRAAVPAARLLVVGDGPLRTSHEARSRELGVDAEFAGWLTPTDVAEHMRTARVLCVPSQRAADGDAEGLPTVIPEACARGLPVVATRHSGIPEALGEDRGGLLANERDIETMARHLIAILTDDDLWRRLSESGRENARSNFDPHRQTAELESFYDEAMNRRI